MMPEENNTPKLSPVADTTQPHATISVQRKRTINPRLIHPKWEFMSETAEFGLWYPVDGIPDLEKVKEFIEAVEELVEQQMAERIQEIVMGYREKARQANLPQMAAEQAFEDVIRDWIIEEHQPEAQSKFTELLIQYAAAYQV